VLIESRDPFEGRGFARRCELAAALLTHGATVISPASASVA
jgi:hypothetical protein